MACIGCLGLSSMKLIRLPGRILEKKYIKLSTPRLGSFICSSLILQGNWSDHCNLILKKKRKKGTPPWYVNVGGHPMESVSHALRKEKGGKERQNFIKEHQCAKFSKNSEPLSLVYYGR
jgi:hypothetical protein